MRRSKKIILITLLGILVLAGSIGGVVMATENGDDSQPEPRHGVILDRVCEIYEDNMGVAINSEELQKAFDQARSEIMTEARNQFRQRLIDEGKVTQEQLDEYDAWLEAKPDDMPFGPGQRGHGGRFGGFGKCGGGFRGWCSPSAESE